MSSSIKKSAHTRLVFFLGVCALFLLPSLTHAEYIESFTSKIEVFADSRYQITEEIEYVFSEDKHGMYRCIPTKHADPASSPLKQRFIDITYTGATIDNGPVAYVVEEIDGDVCIKIGDPNTYVSGEHAYTISYTVEGAVSYTKSGNADIYWDVTGDAWEVSMRSIRVELSSPDDVLVPQRACYQGKPGSNVSCSQTEDGDTFVYTGGVQRPGEVFTVSQALDRSKIKTDIRESFQWFIYAVFGAIIASVMLIFLIYKYLTEHKTDNAIIPQYEPYPNVKPMYMGVLFDGRLDPKDITAGFVYLAQRGYIKVRATEKKVLFLFEVDDFEVVYTKPLDTEATLFEDELITLIFGTAPNVGDVVSLTDLKNNHRKARENQKTIQNLKKGIVTSLQQNNFFTKFGITDFVTQPLNAVFFIVPLALLIRFFSPAVLIVLVIFYIIVIIILSIPKCSKRGYEAREYLEGFKDFLRVTERERYIFHNAPKKSPEQFMEFLPYAIAFGVEKEWAKTFESITIPQPDWYEGGHGASFSAISLTQSLGSFSTAMASSGTSSTSSGGGSAGGGSGGGGGGSW